MADRVHVCEGAITSARGSEGTIEEMDERVANVLNLQQLQQKQEVNQSHTVTNADAEFRRGLEELVRDHLNTCMALASCSSAHDPGISSSSSSNVMSHPSSLNSMHDDATDNHNLLHDNDHNLHHYHSPLHRDDVQSNCSEVQVFQTSDSAFHNPQHILDNEQSGEEESNGQLVQGRGERDGNPADQSARQERPQSRILSIWAAHHAQEMITTMERQAREAELLALAGLHTVSTLDASFLRESPPRSEPSLSAGERPHRRASSIVQMWRELEEERRAERARKEFEDRMAFRTETVYFPQSMGDSENHDGIQIADAGVEQVNAHQGTDSQDTLVNDQTEGSSGSGNLEYRVWEASQVHQRNDMLDSSQAFEGNTSQIEEGEREHVRQIVQRLMTDGGTREGLSTVGQNQNRVSWLDENERERVRELAREWVRVTNERRGEVSDVSRGPPGRQGLQAGIIHGQAPERQMATEGTSSGELGDSMGLLSRSERRLRDQQVILDLLMRIETERQRELQHLVEHRAVSDFAHRNRLQSLLRGRFLHTGAVSEEERPPSSAAGELGLLRQRRAVTGLREGFRFRLETVLRGQANYRSGVERADVHGPPRRRLNQQSILPSGGGNQAVSGGSQSEGVSRDWQGIAAARRVSELQTLEESTAYNMELQELLGRRSVTNVLASEFRDRLDHLIRSFIHSQGHTPVAWDFTRAGRTGVPPQQQPRQQEQQQQEQRQVPNEGEGMVNGIQLPPAVAPPPPPPPPPQPIWQQELQQGTWPRSSLHRPSYLELESINELRTDVSKLQHGMSDLHRMMETCMEMQLELQRAVRQELAGALQRMYDGKVPDEAIDGSKWISVKRGLCCVCCDKIIDSLLYRCGHMCTCLKCASELMRNGGKCPMCRAPILEVVRAFTVA